MFPSYLNLSQGPRQQPTQAVRKHKDTGMMKPNAATSDQTRFTSAVERSDPHPCSFSWHTPLWVTVGLCLL